MCVASPPLYLTMRPIRQRCLCRVCRGDFRERCPHASTLCRVLRPRPPILSPFRRRSSRFEPPSRCNRGADACRLKSRGSDPRRSSPSPCVPPPLSLLLSFRSQRSFDVNKQESSTCLVLSLPGAVQVELSLAPPVKNKRLE